MVILAYLTVVFGVLKMAFLAVWLNSLWILAGILLIPLGCILVLYITTILIQSALVNPKQNHEIKIAKDKLDQSSAAKIAVLGSYGKTTMKELLSTVLSEGKKVAKTPGNKNVLISHARWVNSALKGDEEVLIFEYGEAEPGDITRLAGFSNPTFAVITGIAPAHMDSYPTLDAIVDDFASISDFVDSKNTFINNQELLTSKIHGAVYDSTGLAEWKVSTPSFSFHGTDFTIKNDQEVLHLHTNLLGSHNIGPIVAVVAIAKQLGLQNEQIIAGVAKTAPFEHRMQPRQLHGAWIIDDTYNGNIEGMRAGLELLGVLPAKRKIYVTPGLVDQGTETESVHLELGQLIALASPDKVVLMQNSTTAYIQQGLDAGKYSGEVAIESNPLEYYTNLEHYLAAGDVVMLQNDWPDSYE